MVGVVAKTISSFNESFLVSTEYRQRTKAQFNVLELEAKIQRGKLDALVARVRSVLDYIDMEIAP